MKKAIVMMGFVFLGFVFSMGSAVAQDLKLKEIYQLTPDDVNSGWGIFTPDDLGIVYFEMDDEGLSRKNGGNVRFMKLDINNETVEKLAQYEASNIAFNEYTKPQWLNSDDQILLYECLGFGVHKTFMTDLFGQAIFLDEFLRNMQFYTARGIRLSSDKQNIAAVGFYSDPNEGYMSILLVMPTKILHGENIDSSELVMAPVDLGVMGEQVYSIDDWSSSNIILATEFPCSESNYTFSCINEGSKLFSIDNSGKKKYLSTHACCGSFSPDGEMIAYADTADGQIWIMDKTGKEKNALTSGENRKFMPSFSNDGVSITWTELKSLEQGEAMFGQKKGEGISRFVIMFSNFVQDGDEEE